MNYKVETTTGKSNYLIVTDRLSFGLQLKRKLEQKDINPVLVQKFRLIEWLELKKKVLPRKFDKIIIALFENNFFQKQKEIDLIVDFLKKRKEKKYFLSKYLTPIKNEQKIFEKWRREQTNQKKTILKFNLNLPELNIILGKNLVFLENPKLPISFFYDFYKEGIINDLDEKISLISADDFLDFSFNLLFKPLGEKIILIENEEIESKKITRYILLKNNFKDTNYQIFQAKLKKQKEELNPMVQKVNFSVEKILQKSLISLPPIKNVIGYQANNVFQKRKKSFKEKERNRKEIVFLKEELESFTNETEKREEKKIVPKKAEEKKKNLMKEKTKEEKKEKQEEELQREIVMSREKEKQKKTKRIKIKNQNKKLKKNVKIKKYIKIFLFFLLICFLFFNFLFYKTIEKKVFNKLERKEFVELNQFETGMVKMWLARPKINEFYKKQKNVYDLALAYNDYSKFVKKTNIQKQKIFKHIFQNESQDAELLTGITNENFKIFDFLQNDQEESDLLNTMKEERKKISLLNNISSLWKDFSQKDRQNLLVLFLNEHQSRSTGGTIDAFGILSFRRGQLIDVQILNSQQVNYLLGKNVFVSKEWEEIDENNSSNQIKNLTFFNDFSQVASASAVIGEDVFKKEIDAVYSLNIASLKDFLDVFDDEKIEIEKLHESINQNNIYDRFLFYADDKNKTENHSFTRLYFENFFKKITTLKDEQINNFFKTIYNSLENKNSFLYVFDDSGDSVVKNLKWGGRLTYPNCQKITNENECFLEKIITFDNGIGDNQVASFVKKTSDIKINILEKDIEYYWEDQYQNDVNSYTWPLGNYKFQRQYLLPKNAKDIKVLIDNEQKQDYEIENENEFKKLSLILEIGLKDKKNIRVSFKIDNEIEKGQQWQYSFFTNQQPTLLKNYEKLTINYPNSFELLTISPQANFDLDSRIINFEWSGERKDKFINILFFAH